MKRLFTLVIPILALGLVLQGCGRRSTTEVVGSDTMVKLTQALAEAYNNDNPEANITVTGGGSGNGIAALINGNADIAQASREMKQEEIENARRNKIDVKEYVVAKDGVSVMVHPDNPVGQLTIDQLADIYTGKITNWKDVGGRDESIVVLSRDKSSGTHVFFLEHVLRKGDQKGTEEFAPSVLMLPTSNAIAGEIKGNTAAIGYVGMGFVEPEKHKTVKIAGEADSTYVEPTVENVLKGSYPIARDLYFYTAGEPKGASKGFIDFVLSDEGQRVVESEEFIPIRPVK